VEAYWDHGGNTKKLKISTYTHPLSAHLAPIGYMQILFLKLFVTIFGLKQYPFFKKPKGRHSTFQ
jgi:hypothetical protein